MVNGTLVELSVVVVSVLVRDVEVIAVVDILLVEPEVVIGDVVVFSLTAVDSLGDVSRTVVYVITVVGDSK